METTDTITKEYVEGFGMITDENGEVIGQEKIRSMSPFETKEREQLNIKNTASAMRARVVAEQAKSNGH